MPRPGHPRWSKLTEKQARRIRAALAKGTRYAPLAARFGVSPETLRAIHRGDLWAHLGPPPRPIRGLRSGSPKYGPAFAQEVMALRRRGLSLKAIARKLGMPPSGHQTVRRIVNGTQWAVQGPPKHGPAFAARVLALRANGRTLAAIAEELEAGDETVRRIIIGTHWSVRGSRARSR